MRLQPSKIKQNLLGDWSQCTYKVTGVNVLLIAVILAIKASKRSAVRSNLFDSVLLWGSICKHHCTQTLRVRDIHVTLFIFCELMTFFSIFPLLLSIFLRNHALHYINIQQLTSRPKLIVIIHCHMITWTDWDPHRETHGGVSPRRMCTYGALQPQVLGGTLPRNRIFKSSWNWTLGF